MIVAIVPAAGKSARMGSPKLLLPLGPRRVIEHVLVALSDSNVDRTIVVVPPHADELAGAVHAFPRVDTVQLIEPTPDMRMTVLRGLEWAERRFAPTYPSAFLLAVADQPTISAAIVDQVVARFHATHPLAVTPTYSGRRGHPTLFAWSLVERVRSIPDGCGLNSLVTQLGERLEECPIDRPGVIADLDTPLDYERLQQLDWSDGPRCSPSS